MEEITDDEILRLGGWDARFVSVRAKAQVDGAAVAWLDAGDEPYIEVFFSRDSVWEGGCGTGGALDEDGSSWFARGEFGVVAAYGMAPGRSNVRVEFDGVIASVPVQPSGMWLFIARSDENPAAYPRRTRD